MGAACRTTAIGAQAGDKRDIWRSSAKQDGRSGRGPSVSAMLKVFTAEDTENHGEARSFPRGTSRGARTARDSLFLRASPWSSVNSVLKAFPALGTGVFSRWAPVAAGVLGRYRKGSFERTRGENIRMGSCLFRRLMAGARGGWHRLLCVFSGPLALPDESFFMFPQTEIHFKPAPVMRSTRAGTLHPASQRHAPERGQPPGTGFTQSSSARHAPGHTYVTHHVLSDGACDRVR